MGDEKYGGEKQEYHAEGDIWNLDGFRAVRTGARKILKNEIPADQRTYGRPDGIERLRQIQSAGRGSLRPEYRHVRIGGDLQHRESEPHNEQSDEKQRVRQGGRGRPEQGATGGRNQKSDDDAVLVTDAGDRTARRCGNQKIEKCADEVGAKKGELHEHRLEVVERERLLESRDQDVVEDGHEAPHEEQDRHDGKWTAIGRCGAGLRGWFLLDRRADGFHGDSSLELSRF